MIGYRMKTAFLGTVTAAALLAGTGAANAVPIDGLFAPINDLLSDISAEQLIDHTNSPNTVDVGDELRGIVEMGRLTVNGGPAISLGSGTVWNELTGVFDIVVTSRIPFNGGTCTSAFCYTFGPNPTFAAQMAAAGFTNTPNSMLAFWQDPAQNFNRALLTDTNLVTPGTQTTPASIAADIATMEATASGGSKFWLFGLDLADDFWVARADTSDISIASSVPLNTSFGRFDLGLSLLSNFSLVQLGTETCLNPLTGFFTVVNACGNGLLLAKGPTDGGPGGAITHINSAYDSFDNTNFNVTVVPEPATISLLGLGLLGMGVARRRRNKKQ